MAGEIPTEDSAKQQVTATIARASQLLLSELEYSGRPDLEDLILEEVYVAIHSLYGLRGKPGALANAITQAAEENQKNLKLRAELLEKYGFGSDTEAAEHIASYWQGDKPDDLLRSIMGFGEIELWRQASQYATAATSDNPDARKQFHNASDLLWRDYRAGLGGQMVE